MVRCGIVRSGMVRSFGWADGAEAAEGALGALGADGALCAVGADCAEGAFGALPADCAEAALGALGAKSAEGALGADCFGCAALVAGCAGNPHETLPGGVTGLGGAGGPAIAAKEQPKKHARILAFIPVLPELSIFYEDEATAGVAPGPQEDVFIFGALR
jgi:hypothetical protein